MCPLCGQSQAAPLWNRKTVLFGMMAMCLLVLMAVLFARVYTIRTARGAAVKDVMRYVSGSAAAAQVLGAPIQVESGVRGGVQKDETGWNEVKLLIPVLGPKGEGMIHVAGAGSSYPWTFTTIEIEVEQQHKKVDVLTGRIAVYEPGAYVDVHTLAAQQPELLREVAPAAIRDGTFPCILARVDEGRMSPSIERCATPTGSNGALDQTFVDLRYGSFGLQQTDLRLNDVFDVPLTRTYRSDDRASANPMHAFGMNSTHPYDIAPLGTRNPYTWQVLALEDGEDLFFERISKGTGYDNSVFQHTETSTRYYKATTSWNGHGWTMILADGSRIEFPESYNAKNLAQGAPVEMVDPAGRKLELRRDGQRNLQEIETPGHHWIKFHYDDQARVTRADDDAGSWTAYAYGPAGLLVDVVHSSGAKRHYTYDKLEMTTMSDESGRVMLRNTYDRGMLLRQDYASGESFLYKYTLDRTRRYAEKVEVTMPDASKRVVAMGDSIPEGLRR